MKRMYPAWFSTFFSSRQRRALTSVSARVEALSAAGGHYDGNSRVRAHRSRAVVRIHLNVFSNGDDCQESERIQA